MSGRSCSAGAGAGVDVQADHLLAVLSLADLVGTGGDFGALHHQNRVERWEAGGNPLRRELSWQQGKALLWAVGSPWRMRLWFLEVVGSPWRRVLLCWGAVLAGDNPWKKGVWWAGDSPWKKEWLCWEVVVGGNLLRMVGWWAGDSL